jgi:two-component system phosphate regulon response regulator PhoB
VASIAADKLSVGIVEVDIQRHEVLCGGKTVQTSPTEFRLLVSLMQSPGRVFSREQLLDKVWGMTVALETRTVDVHIGRLRRALAVAGGRDLVCTVRGFGYSIG